MSTPFGLCGDSPHEALVAIDRKAGTAVANRAARELFRLDETSPLTALPARLATDPAEQEAFRTTLETGKELRLTSNPEGISCRVLVHRTDDPDTLLLHLKDTRELEMIKFQLSEYAEALITNFYHLEVANRSIGNVEKEKTSIVQAAIEWWPGPWEMSDRYNLRPLRASPPWPAGSPRQAASFAPAELEVLAPGRPAARHRQAGRHLRHPAQAGPAGRHGTADRGEAPPVRVRTAGNLPDFTAIAEICVRPPRTLGRDRLPAPALRCSHPPCRYGHSCADTFDAICTNRPYRPAHGIDYAYHQITGNNGTQFNPQVVDWFLTVPREDFVRIEGQWQIS
jgi:hypothetical protein